jgi:hypothetical protein
LLNAFMVSGWREARVPERRLAAPAAWAFLIRGVRTLERVDTRVHAQGGVMVALRRRRGGRRESSWT